MSDSPIRITIDRGRCAICDEPNECALAQDVVEDLVQDGVEKDQSCWCVGESFPATLIARATGRDGGDRCICRRCLEKERRSSGQD